jgi:hypothetical protein
MHCFPSARPRRVALLGGLCLTVAFGCGGKVDAAEMETGDASRAEDASSTVASSDASAMADDESAMSKDSAAGDAGGRVQITLNYSPPSFIGLDCRLNAATDPVGLNVNVAFDSPAGEGSQAVTFPAGRIKFSRGSKALIWNFQVMTEPVTPGSSPPLVVENLWNLPGSGPSEGAGAPCAYCGEMAEFDLQVRSPGQSAFWDAWFSPVDCMQ